MTSIIPERLAALDDLTLHSGSHNDFNQGHCAMEVVSWLVGLGFTDAPSCASPVLRRYTIALNDRWDSEQRQSLKPFLPRMVATGNDGKDNLRQQIATRMLAERLLDPWLRLAGMNAEADSLAQLQNASIDDLRRALNTISDAAWELRRTNREALRVKVRAELERRGAVAAAAADAAAVADAVAAADAVAVAAAAAAAAAAADAAADADAVADAVAAAVADAAADAVAAAAAAAAAAADAVAAAVADAVADAVAAAAAAADAVADAVAANQDTWSAAYWAARKYYEEHPLPVSQQIADLAASQQGLALELLDAMIDPQAVSA